jgi:mannitol/fructose-specific phosphotransferase system IIA component (Ntr-type)
MYSEKQNVSGSSKERLTLGDLVPESAVLLDLPDTEKTKIIERLTASLEPSGAVVDFDKAVADLIDREKQGSTALGRGVALPHAKTLGVRSPGLAFGLCRGGVEFESMDGLPVHLVFLFVVPRARPGLHLKVLAALNRFLRNEENRKSLLGASDETSIRKILSEVRIN